MGPVHYIAIWGMSAILAAAAGGIVAGVKRRDHSAWAAWCFVAPPLLVWLLLLPANRGPRPRRPSFDEDDRRNDDDRVI